MPGCLPKSNSAPLPEVINIFQFRPYFEALQSLLKELTPIVTTDTNVSDYTAGLPSQVYIKNHNRTRWDAPRYLGPFEVTQRTDTAVKVAGRDNWYHWSHLKPCSEKSGLHWTDTHPRQLTQPDRYGSGSKGNRTVLPGCESYTKYANLSNWIQPVNWTVKTNETLKKGLQFAGSTHFREELVAPFCFKRECRKGDWLLGKTPCLDYLGDGFTNREETWATRVAKLHSELVNTTELKCSDCMVIGQRWPLNHTTWTKLVQKTLTYSPWIPVPPRWGFPTPVGQVWLCGSNSYLTLPVNWCGTSVQKYRHHNLHKHGMVRRAMLKVGDRTLGQSYVPFSDNGGRKPLFGDGRGLLATLVPMIGVAASMQRLNEVWWILEDLTEVIDGVLDQMERSPELKAVAAVAMQNRVALDALYAEQGGMCAAVGIDHCCTYIPDDTGNWTAIKNRVKELKDFLESQEDQGPQWTWLNWLNSGSWIHILQKVGIFIGIVLLFCCMFCFVVPLIRSMVSRALGSTGGIYMVSCAPPGDTELGPRETSEGGVPNLYLRRVQEALKYEWNNPE
uniref:Uncharacterized protein n=1 Tax=Neogobius melanostomus TaxID=47308 RepID=A0A8C6WJK4_9GOBI